MAEQDQYLFNSGDIFLKVVELTGGGSNTGGVVRDVGCIVTNLASGVISLRLGSTNVSLELGEVGHVLVMAALKIIISHLDLVDSESDSFDGDHSVGSKIDSGGEGRGVHEIGTTLIKVASLVDVGSSGLDGSLVDESFIRVEELFRSHVGLDLSTKGVSSKESGSEGLH